MLNLNLIFLIFDFDLDFDWLCLINAAKARTWTVPVVTCQLASFDVLATVAFAVAAFVVAFDVDIAVAYWGHVDDSSCLFGENFS